MQGAEERMRAWREKPAAPAEEKPEGFDAS